MATGIVRSYNPSRGFGLIAPDLGGPLLFVHQTAIRTPDAKKLKASDRVEFEVEQRADGPVIASLRTIA